MYLLSLKYFSISSFFVKINLAIQKGKLLNLNTGLSLSTNIFINELMFFEEKIILLDDTNRPIFYNQKTGKFNDALFNEFRISNLINNLAVFYKKGKIRKYGLWDVTNKVYLFESENSCGVFIFKNNIFGENEAVLSSKKIFDGFVNWTLNISEIGYFEHPFEVLRNPVEVQQFVGVYEDLLWVFLRNQVFLGIDIHTGKVMHKLYKVATECHQNQDYDQSFEPWFLALIPNANWFLDESTGTIKGLSRQCYVEVNIKKVIEEPKKSVFSNLFGTRKNTEVEPTIAVYHFFSLMRTLDLRNIASRLTVIDDESKIIYFGDEDTGRWGLYNTHAKVFEYISEQIPVEKAKDKKGFTRLKEIKQGGNKVYVLDMQQTLHIFEKEINI